MKSLRMVLRKANLFFLLICLLMTAVIIAPSTKSDINSENTVSTTSGYAVEETSAQKYDYYNMERGDDVITLDAIKTVSAKDLKNVAISSDEKVSVAYSFRYDTDADVITVLITTSSGDEILDVQEVTAYPFRYGDGKVDAYIYLPDGTTLYLSEIYDGEVKNCFLGISILFGSLLTAVIAAAKAVILVTGVIVIAGVTIQAIQLTKAKIEERTREAEKEKTKKNPKYYYPATRKGGKLLIANIPHYLLVAAKHIVNGQDYWSPFDYTAKKLAITASGGCIGPDIDKDKKGKYYHYHLKGRIGGHSFYGTPEGGVY